MALKYRRVRISYTHGSPTEQAHLARRVWEWSRHPDLPGRGEWYPPTDVYEVADQVVVKVELAGAREDDIQVTVFDDLLVISGHRRDNVPQGDGVTFHQAGIRYGPFQSEVLLPRRVGGGGCQARYEQGFLYVLLPKAE